ncbi:putative histone-lysine N-methyltransferase Mes-4 [Pseudolycoriella hygida]|uniref:Histone-lysine N-methyltransferase Mes-4 n=1 Tax=Pseudolycoriella hygida TaxID=35572 RepID=A0A9Q0N1U9_9DIPT|nr:putative histone-lysine N-methyltransferase Mes-4 [Pseudolycoriella hygida]
MLRQKNQYTKLSGLEVNHHVYFRFKLEGADTMGPIESTSSTPKRPREEDEDFSPTKRPKIEEVDSKYESHLIDDKSSIHELALDYKPLSTSEVSSSVNNFQESVKLDAYSSFDFENNVECPNESDITFSPNVHCMYDVPLKLYVGQVLYALHGKTHYWPSVVCDVEESNEYIFVQFLACNGRVNYVRRDRVLQFDGMESFLQHQNCKSACKFKFRAKLKKPKLWYEAVVEGKFILSKEVNLRLAFVNIISMSRSLHVKRPSNLSKFIANNTAPSQLKNVQMLIEENPNIFENTREKLEQIAPSKIQNAVQQQHSVRIKAVKIARRRLTRYNSVGYRRSSRLTSAIADPSKFIKIVPNTKTRTRFSIQERRTEKRIEFETDLEIYAATLRQKGVLFKDKQQGRVCKICLRVDNAELVQCSGVCTDYLHEKCVGPVIDGSQMVKCSQCVESTSPVCYICTNVNSEIVVRCSEKKCDRFYHLNCLRDWPQTKYCSPEKFTCPLHVCHICISDDPCNIHCPMPDSKLARCIQCPATYHHDSTCIPAGVKILNARHLICPRHRSRHFKPVHVNWCYICRKKGGNFHCVSCPLSVHMSCLHESAAGKQVFYCDKCQRGRHPLYGEVVWVKYSSYRFWPAIVVPPPNIPSRVQCQMRYEHDLCIRFFGSYDFGWVDRSAVYLYQEGDDKEHGNWNAVKEADKFYRKLNVNVKEIVNRQPLPYTNIRKSVRVGSAQLNKSDLLPKRCECSPTDLDPCGPSSTCINRELYVECDATMCPARDNCRNQCIAKRIYAKVAVKYVGKKGFGLMAAEFIKKDTMVIEYVGELIDEDEFHHRRTNKTTECFYYLLCGNGLYIDAEYKGNESRFINHSCNPNVQLQRWDVNGFTRFSFYATEDIQENTEITFDYQCGNYAGSCYCGSANCKKTMGRYEL